VTKVVLDEESRRIEVVVPDEQLSLAIGRRGQNVRLASNLTGWDIDILTEAEESDRRQEEFRTRSEMFMEALDVDDVIAHLLVTEGFSTVDEVAYAPIDELAAIEGFEEELASELATRAAAHVEATNRALNERRLELGVSDEVAAIEGLEPAMLVALGENEIKTLDDLGDLAGDELVEMLGDMAPSMDEANAVIMQARAHWFDHEEPGEAKEAGEAGEAGGTSEAGEAGDTSEAGEPAAEEHERANV
jgi:N utilization substance protein A